MSEKQIRSEFAKLIKKWRLDRNIGLRDFAKLLKISPVTLSHIESGRMAEERRKDLKKSIKNGKCFICANEDIREGNSEVEDE